jgi:hypothetical protein
MTHFTTGQTIKRRATSRLKAAEAYVHLVQRDSLGGATKVVLEYLPSGVVRRMTYRRAAELFPPQG